MSSNPQFNTQEGVSTREFNSVRQSVKLLLAQLEAGRMDREFIEAQVIRVSDLMEQLAEERQQVKQGKRFEALYNVSRILGSSLALQKVLDQVMDAVIQLTGAERGFLMLRDQDGGLEVKAARNLDQETLDSSQFHYSRTISNTVLDTKEAVVTTNAAEDPRFAGRDSIMGQALRSIMATPLRARGEVVGVAYVDSRMTMDLFDEADLNALEALAGQAAIAIENARLFEQTDQQLAAIVDQLKQLRRIDRQLNETLDPDNAMKVTLEWAAKLSKAEYGYLGLLEGQALMVPTVQHYGVAAGVETPSMLDEAYPQVAQVVNTGRSLTDTIEVNGKTQSFLILPINRDQKVFGVVVLHKADDDPFASDEVDIAGRVVNRAAVTIENAHLYAAVQAADRAKSEFVGIVAHDLKVPMTSILGYTSLTKLVGQDEGNLVGRQEEFLDKISETVKRMAILVDDLSDISRIESGHFYMETIDVSVSRIIEDVQDNTLTQMNDRGHTFILDIEDDLPDMFVDYYRLLQVLTNLVSNAYKYTPDNGTITLSAKRDNDRIRFTVSDTGIGLSDAQIAMLGTKFWRASDEYTRRQPGTGLGFAITKSLVQLMGSGIDIQSEVGEGSAFSFTVPIHQPDSAN
jgi:signal transduction histidine kinase